MKHFFKLLKEVVFGALAILVALGGVYLAINTINAQKSFDTLNAKVVKKELRIVSPVFGNLEAISASEGTLVKKGETIALIKLFNSNNEVLNIDSSTFHLNKDEVEVIAPEDSIVARTIFAEKSVLKPGVDFLVLYPLKDVTVEINIPKDASLSNYKNITVVNNIEEYSLEDVKSLPIDQSSSGENVGFAKFSNIGDSIKFPNGQTVTVKAVK